MVTFINTIFALAALVLGLGALIAILLASYTHGHMPAPGVFFATVSILAFWGGAQYFWG